MGAEQSIDINLSNATRNLSEESTNEKEEFETIENVETDLIDLFKCLDLEGSAYLIADLENQNIIFANKTVQRAIVEVSFKDKKVAQFLDEVIEISDERILRDFENVNEAKVIPFCGKFKNGLFDSEMKYFQLFIAPLKMREQGQVLLCSLDMIEQSLFDTDLTCSLGYKCWVCSQNKIYSEDCSAMFFPAKKLSKFDNSFVQGLKEREDMFCVTDPAINDNPIIFVSDDFLKVTGYKRHEIEGKNCRFLQGEDTSPDDVSVIRTAVKECKNASICLLNYRKDGSKFINQFNLNPLFDEEGQLAYYIGVQMDVENADVSPLPNRRQSLAEIVNDCERDERWVSFEQNAY
mmetsp:Transcript_19670/g.29127  ORF Transcript_19670/g.29127 Transcript_19670/m.29127 type:complete len:349 (-) Transcript_19670:29-1075(-)|eukprot:CAMPEP_0171470636 /NCGR_PEP_ID=MMETSP0946-20130122/258_1 /TAXON_ID=109269 /ORGANISM="Vaucheria litorea, Strain CCMP2940" /LENGTH=348 /DNA_ID=CAMNT_0012000035 /DNA_START=53 /DNA_END=1099 /DNA_ORIENTATION=-